MKSVYILYKGDGFLNPFSLQIIGIFDNGNLLFKELRKIIRKLNVNEEKKKQMLIEIVEEHETSYLDDGYLIKEYTLNKILKD